MEYNQLKGSRTLAGEARRRKTIMKRKYMSMLNEKGIVDIENGV